MLKNRLIPVVLIRSGIAVQSKGFRRRQALGDPITIVERLSDWASDELIYLDISPEPALDPGLLREVARRCVMPLTLGGGVRTIADAASRVTLGADKVSFNTAALREPGVITEAAREFGSQAVVVNIDAAPRDGGFTCLSDGGRIDTGRDAVAWAREAVDRGAGEILLQAVHRDGLAAGYDLDLVRAVTAAVDVPVIALGGVGRWEHLLEGLAAGADAVAAANIFNYTEQAVLTAKSFMSRHGANIRPPELFTATMFSEYAA